MSTTIPVKAIDLDPSTHLFLHLALADMFPPDRPADPNTPPGFVSVYKKMSAGGPMLLTEDEWDSLVGLLEYEKDEAEAEEPGGPISRGLNDAYKRIMAQVRK